MDALFLHSKLDWTLHNLDEQLQAEPQNIEVRLELARCWLHGAAPPAAFRGSEPRSLLPIEPHTA